jgi:hypothetical protein
MTNLTDLGIADLRDGFRKGDFSAREAADAFIGAMEAGRALNAFLVETPEHAIAAAEEADRGRASGELRPLSGVPLGIKDLFCTAGYQTTAASHILEGFTPTYESTVTAKLFAAGAGMLGKLNMDQFAMGSSNETSAFGNVISPWRRADGGNAPLAPGGSSGGSSAAVSARMAPGATDGHGWLDPSARRLHRHLRDQADLWTLLALGDRRVRLIARSGRADGARRAGLRDPAGGDERLRPQGFDLARRARPPVGGRAFG